MRHLLTLLLLAVSAFAQTATISDTITTPFGGTFGGTVTVSLNSPALAQPLYSGNVTLSGWSQTVTVTAGVFTLTLYTNDLITPGGTSYTATYAPTSGSAWKETWVVPTGATTIREIRSTTVPSPSVRFNPSQITQAGATLGQGLRWNGSIWAPATFVADPMTATGDLITRSNGVPVRVGIGSTNQVLTVSGGMPVWASGITGNASTATALQTARTIAGTSFDGTANINIASTGLSDSSALVRNNQANTYTAGNKQTFASNATTAGAAFGGGITADPSSVTAGDFWYRADLGTFGFRNSSAVDALVAGGRALTTPGSVPLVTAAGVLGQSANLFWDNANARLGVGTNAPQRPAHIRNAGGLRIDTASSGFDLTNTNTGEWQITAVNSISRFGILGSLWTHSATGNVAIGTTTDDGTNRLQVAGNIRVTGTNYQFFGDDGTVAVRSSNATNGTLQLFAAGQAMLTVSNAGTITAYNPTPTTGSTSLVVRAGAGQGGNNLTTWQTSGGTVMAGVSNDGNLGTTNQLAIWTGALFGGTQNVGINNVGVDVGSAHLFRFSSTGNSFGTKDLSLSRASAGTLQVGDGSANSNGTILARIYTWANGTEGTCDATLRGQVVMVQGGAGVADRLRLCRKDATDTYLWAPIENNVALQVVSAGPTATVTNQVRRVYVDPASVIASLTLTLPAAPLDADQVQVFFGGTLANQAAVVTTLTISPNAGQAISQFNAPVAAFGGDMVTYEYRTASARWYRIQ